MYLKLLRICLLLVALIMGSPLMDAKGSTITMVAPSMINVEVGWDELQGKNKGLSDAGYYDENNQVRNYD